MLFQMLEGLFENRIAILIWNERNVNFATRGWR